MSFRKFIPSLLLGGLLFCAGAQAQTVTKVEPPNWWTVTKPTELTLLFTGENLSGATVKTTAPGITVRAARPSANGSYLFCDITVAPGAKVGKAAFEIAANGKTITSEWPLLKPLPTKGNYQGITRDDVIYFLMIDRFADGDPSNNEPRPGKKTFDRSAEKQYHGGDLRGVIKNLDYIKSLGATAVWLTPVYDNNNESGIDYHGYGMMDFYGVEEHFGTMADYQELCRELHKRGMKLIQDVVPNHTGPFNSWVKNPPTPTWFNGTVENHVNCNFDIPTMVNPKATAEARALVTDGWFAGFLPDLNGRDPEYQRFAIQNSLWWTYMSGQDGLRLDTYPYVDRSLWAVWQKEINAHFPNLFDVGEVWNGDQKVVSFYAGGQKRWDGIDTGLKALFDFPLLYGIRDFTCNPETDATRITKILDDDPLYGDMTSQVTFIGNHDITRVLRDANGDARRVKLAFALQLTTRGIIQLYAGDEIAMDGGGDPDNRRDFPGGFGQEKSAFTATGRTPAQQSMWLEVQKLLAIRRANSALRYGTHVNLLAQGKSYAYLRDDKKRKVVVVVNGSDKPATVAVPKSDALTAGRSLASLNEPGAPVKVGGDGFSVSLPPFGYRIFAVK